MKIADFGLAREFITDSDYYKSSDGKGALPIFWSVVVLTETYVSAVCDYLSVLPTKLSERLI